MNRDELIARVRELEQQNAVQRENVDEAMRQNTRLTGVVRLVESAILEYGLVATSGRDGEWFCQKCGAHAKKPYDVPHTDRCVVGSVAVAIRGALPASDNAPFRQPPHDPETCTDCGGDTGPARDDR